jgi:Protein of unknown function (DUF4238)
MSGSKQHYIPQFVLSGFASTGRGKHKQVNVHRRDKIFLSSTEGIGAEREFYSALNQNIYTLDDIITEAEARDYSQIYRSLLDTKPGQKIDNREVSRLVTHLAIRSNHIRECFAVGTHYIHQRIIASFSDIETCRKILGFAGSEPNDKTKMILDRLFNENKADIQTAGMSRHTFRNYAFQLAKERFDTAFVELFPAISATFGGINHFDVVANAHNDVLSKNLEPEARVAALTQFDWKVVNTEEPLILPDCIAIADDAVDGPMPLAFCDTKDIHGVIFPLTANKALCAGSYQAEVILKSLLPNFQFIAAQNSWNFFIADPQQHVEVSTNLLIGDRVFNKFISLVDKFISEEIMGELELT